MWSSLRDALVIMVLQRSPLKLGNDIEFIDQTIGFNELQGENERDCFKYLWQSEKVM